MRSNRNVLHPSTCKFWNKSQCKKGKECEYTHFHFKFFHKTTIPTTNGTPQEINKQYSQQVEAGNLLVYISQISFMSWYQVQQLAKIMNTGVFLQTISIATLNKKAEYQYAKEIKNQSRLDDDPSMILDQKIHAFNQNYENLIKKDIKTEQSIKRLKNKTQSKNINQKIIFHQNNNNQMVDESSKINNNKQQYQSITKNDPRMEVEMILKHQTKQKLKNKKTSQEEQVGDNDKKKQQEQTTPLSISLITIQQEIKDLTKITLSKTTKTPSKDLTEQDPDKSLDETAIIHEANELFAKIASKLDPTYINELMKKANKEKKLPDDNTNLIISQQIQLGQLWKSRLVQMISMDGDLIKEIYQNTGINNRKIRRNTQFAMQRSAPILYIIRLQHVLKRSQRCIQNEPHHSTKQR